MKFQRNLKAEATIDLTPVIDVVFILLLFFIVTTSFTRESNLSINLPEAAGEAAVEAPLQLEIVVASNGTYAVNGRALVNTRIDTLMTAISELAGDDQSLPITITADAAATHQSVVTAMDAVAQLGFTKLNIATRQPEALAE